MKNYFTNGQNIKFQNSKIKPLCKNIPKIFLTAILNLKYFNVFISFNFFTKKCKSLLTLFILIYTIFIQSHQKVQYEKSFCTHATMPFVLLNIQSNKNTSLKGFNNLLFFHPLHGGN